MSRFVVRYYDAALSKRGQGVQARAFDTREEAEPFASGRVLYGRRARVVETAERGGLHPSGAALPESAFALTERAGLASPKPDSASQQGRLPSREVLISGAPDQGAVGISTSACADGGPDLSLSDLGEASLKA